MNGFERRREQKKKAILEAAGKVFFDKGFKDTNMEEIAALAEVSPVSVYNFFGTKSNLYVRVIEEAFYEAMDDYDRILNSDMSFYGKLLEFMKYKMSTRSAANPDFFKHEDLMNPEIAAIISEVKEKRILPFFCKLVEQGKEEGAIDKSIDIQSVIMYINIFTSGLTNPQIAETLSNDSKLTLDMGKLFLFGFAGSSGSGQVPKLKDGI
jgi:AcrR family transcriptional regulator